ncbi:MAG: molybdopterin oxidoreductase, partial [Chloroflexota bacterium]
MPGLSRRDFLKLAAGLGAGAGAALVARNLAFLEEVTVVENPLAAYPNRDWEKAYRELFNFDSKFAFLCAPNDTHNCLLLGVVKHGIVTRIEPSYGYGQAVDVYGNQASHRWEPRACQKGLSLTRRIYGDRRIKGPMVRKGFLEWARAGYPRDPETGVPPAQYFRRGQDEWLRLTWDEAYRLVAQTIVNIAATYSGQEGQERLRRQGYDPAMVEATAGAGTQVLKFRGGMPFLGATRIFGFYRFANMLALLDAYIRKVPPDQALGARGWDNYSWHTDLPPGHPMVTGQQTVDFDLFTAENARLITLWGMNWICTKMPDGHWLTEARLHGAKVIVIACEYQATASKADEVVIIRPGTDTALALGIARVIIEEGLFDGAFVKSFTDLPLLVRLDTLQLLRAAEVVPGYRNATLGNFTKVLEPGQTADPPINQAAQYVPRTLRDEWGDFVVWDLNSQSPRVITRDQVGKYFQEAGIDPALRGTFSVRTVDGRTVQVRPVFDLLVEYLENFDPVTVSEVTWAPVDAVYSLARQIAANPGRTLIVHGMGPNH